MSRAAQMANRVALLSGGLALLCALSVSFAPSPAAAGVSGPAGSEAETRGASASIVNGRVTTIGEWPWQVALTVSKRIAPRFSTSRRFFCGGALLAPRLVVTAAHCVANLKRKRIRQIEIVSGRTNLNSGRGEVVRVTGLRMPVNESGQRRYRSEMGATDWDVALLTLATPLSAEPIKLAGPDETGTWSPGHLAWTTGWGITRPFSNHSSPRLRLARQVLMRNGLCRRSEGLAFKAARMICLGGSGGNASTCSGDSGGPLMVRTSAGYRLVGLTSFGDGACRGMIPSIDTRVAGNTLGRWIARMARNLVGADVVGSGGTAGPPPQWCRVPAVLGLRPARARQKLNAANCRLGEVRVERWAVGPRGRIVGYNRLPGWLAPPGFRLRVWVAR